MATWQSLDTVSLQSVDTFVSTAMSNSESQLNLELQAVATMTSMGIADMIQIQYYMANYTIAGQTLSAIMKDMSDTFKSVVQKIG
ncbi:MAG TPA: EscF/YscF/HrpA family type III secretion system needle major subunit [Burkholderiaceae bacterium]|jgi:hypothetical protein|nr:EscF/YscF/HrpA family type III secretion system needle major subunit [Burkholderiaceae bacterium]